MSYLLVAAGLGLLLLGGEMLVRGAVALARRLGVSPLLIGITIVAYGTSAPELLVSVEAHLSGHTGLAVGNVVGSNIANLLLILGAAALVYPLRCAPGAIRRGGTIMLGSTVLLAVLGWSGAITPWPGLLMVAALIAFSYLSYRWETTPAAESDAETALHLEEEREIEETGPQTLAGANLCLAAGLVGVVAGSHFLILGSVDLARHLGVTEEVIGLTLVALGTSLPELATSVVAAYRRHPDVALGNVIGANTFNILGIMGVVPLFARLEVSPAIARFDLWIMLAVTLCLVPWIQWCGRVGRPLGVVLLALYVAYVAAQYLGMSGAPMSQG
jgi:cation:H+ antiporter